MKAFQVVLYMAALLALYIANTRISGRKPGFLTRAPPWPHDHVLLGPHRMEPALRTAWEPAGPLVAAQAPERPYDSPSGRRMKRAAPSAIITRPRLRAVQTDRALLLHHAGDLAFLNPRRLRDRARAPRASGYG